MCHIRNYLPLRAEFRQNGALKHLHPVSFVPALYLSGAFFLLHLFMECHSFYHMSAINGKGGGVGRETRVVQSVVEL